MPHDALNVGLTFTVLMPNPPDLDSAVALSSVWFRDDSSSPASALFCSGAGLGLSTVSQLTSALVLNLCTEERGARVSALSEHLKRPTDARTGFGVNGERCARRSQEIHGARLIVGKWGISSLLESLPGERDETTMWSRPGRVCPSSL